MTRRLAAAALGAVAVLACGNQPATSAPSSPPPPTSGTAAGGGGVNKELLFAVLEPGGDLTAMRDNTLAIVRTNGTALARTHFDARQLPRVGNALPLPQPEARVAAGKVYFADGAGVVRSLAMDGTVASVTTFPLANAQQLMSFAVSPDGTQLLGAVFSFPPLHLPPPQPPIAPPLPPPASPLPLLS